MVEEASTSKAPIAKLADKVSAVFVPSVLLISLVTLIGWLLVGRELGFAIARAISVLVISCPCALGLATPVAIMVGSGVGARRGVLFKTAAAIEEMGRVDTVVLDKTGTLTVGEPGVTDIIPVDGTDEKELIALAYSVEKMSEHPIARALVAYAEKIGVEPYEVTNFESKVGRGVSATVNGKELSVLSFSEAEKTVSVPVELADSLSEQGKTPLAFLYDGKYIGAVALSDTLKPDAGESVEYLKATGLKVVMLSGDNERTARAVARELGIDNVVAGVLPDGKDEVIRTLMDGGKVCMVGDGINDSPALTRANVGVAIGHGTDIAIDSADVVVMGNGVSEVAYAIGIGRATLKNIRENLFWAFIYNCIGIPLAAGLFGLSLSPMIGAAMMSLSSVSVVSNALRLNLWKPKKICNNSSKCEELVTNSATQENIIESKEDEKMTVVIKVDGMMCPHCEARVKKACESCEGVTLATPSHTEGTVTLEMVKDVTEECKKAISDAGYDIFV
jgi:Cu2+-exporting ATPase